MEKKVYDFTSFINLSEAQIEDPSTIVIGDSQTPIIAAKSKIATLLGTEGSEKTLWKSGMGVKWLYDSLKRFPITPKIKNVILSIGTNGGFNPYDNISNLVDELRRVFPSANFYVVQGSWGWGGVSNKTETQVKEYYKKFSELGVVVVEPPIGKIEPHGRKPIYKTIGTNLDSLVKTN
jgi:hypothetical protein